MGIVELALIGVVVLLIFGATRLPRLARSVARTPGEFRAGLDQRPQGQREGRDV